MDIETVRKNYRNLEDYKIEELANSQARTLRPEIIPILIEEIERRNLSTDLLRGIEAQLKVPTTSEIDEYSKRVNRLPCPKCGSKTQRLNAAIFRQTTSAIIFTSTRAALKIACSGCLEKFRNNANFKTATLGWWGFPWGPIKTIQSLIANSKMSRQIEMDEPNEILKAFVYENIGVIETNKDDKRKLQNLLSDTNRRD